MGTSYPTWTAKIWETGEFTFGYLPSKRIDRTSATVDPDPTEEDVTNIHNCIAAHGIEVTLAFLRANPEFYPSLPKPLPPLDSSNAPNSHSAARRGQNGISGHGKKLVRNGALRMERESGVRNLSFLTLTIPGIGEEGAIALVDNWAEVVRVFQQKLKRRLIKCGLPGEIIGVTEVQEKRMASSGVVALHLHLLFQGRQPYKHWALSPGEVRGMWRDTLSPYLSQFSSELYWDACENLVPVKRSAVGYLGKYLSKGSKVCKEIIKNYPDIVLPSCWYICTNTLRKRVYQNIAYLTSDSSPWFSDICSSQSSLNCFVFIHPVFIPMKDGSQLHIGWIGKLDPDFLRIVKLSRPGFGHVPPSNPDL